MPLGQRLLLASGNAGSATVLLVRVLVPALPAVELAMALGLALVVAVLTVLPGT